MKQARTGTAVRNGAVRARRSGSAEGVSSADTSELGFGSGLWTSDNVTGPSRVVWSRTDSVSGFTGGAADRPAAISSGFDRFGGVDKCMPAFP